MILSSYLHHLKGPSTVCESKGCQGFWWIPILIPVKDAALFFDLHWQSLQKYSKTEDGM